MHSKQTTANVHDAVHHQINDNHANMISLFSVSVKFIYTNCRILGNSLRYYAKMLSLFSATSKTFIDLMIQLTLKRLVSVVK